MTEVENIFFLHSSNEKKYTSHGDEHFMIGKINMFVINMIEIVHESFMNKNVDI